MHCSHAANLLWWRSRGASRWMVAKDFQAGWPHLIVAPAEPVPERRKMILEPSSNTKRRPCLLALLPSTGSVYSKSSASLSAKGPSLLPGLLSAMTLLT